MPFRPATPGFLVTLAATALLAVVSFSVPLLKSVYFLKANVQVSGVDGSVTFGVLGYCIQIADEQTCTSPTIGYEFNPNALLGNNTPFQIPDVVVKWITYIFILHLVALGLSALAAIFGLLAHVREMSMSCFSSCISGFAAAVTVIAFVFDLVLFFVVRARINAVPGGSAEIGIGVWLTLAAWVLLFFSGCFYGFGRCCISKRPRVPGQKKRGDVGEQAASQAAEMLRLDAVKAEADRKARQRAQEGGLPAFTEYESKPLRSEPQYLEESDDEGPYRDHQSSRDGSAATNYAGRGVYAGGYLPGPAGTRTMDAYRDPYQSPRHQVSLPQPEVYNDPRQPARRQPSLPQQDVHGIRQPAIRQHGLSPPMPAPGLPIPQPTHVQVPSAASYIPVPQPAQYPSYGGPVPQQDQQFLTPGGYPTVVHESPGPGHGGGGTSYHSAMTHQNYPSQYSQNDGVNAYPPSSSPQPSDHPSYSPIARTATTDPYGAYNPSWGDSNEYNPSRQQTAGYHSEQQPYYQQPRYPQGHQGYQPEAHNNVTTSLNAGYAPQQHSASPPPIQRVASPPLSPTTPRGPRGPRQQSLPPLPVETRPPASRPVEYTGPDSPPLYESPPGPATGALSNIPAWPREKQ